MIHERPAGVGVWAYGGSTGIYCYSVKAHLDLCHHWPLKHTDMAYCLTVSKFPKTTIFIHLTSEQPQHILKNKNKM